jgi:hypothetical protein
MICSMILCCRVGVSFVVFVFVFVFVFVYMWASRLSFSLSLCGRLVRLFLFLSNWVSWLPKPILVLLEGGAA